MNPQQAVLEYERELFAKLRELKFFAIDPDTKENIVMSIEAIAALIEGQRQIHPEVKVRAAPKINWKDPEAVKAYKRAYKAERDKHINEKDKLYKARHKAVQFWRNKVKKSNGPDRERCLAKFREKAAVLWPDEVETKVRQLVSALAPPNY